MAARSVTATPEPPPWTAEHEASARRLWATADPLCPECRGRVFGRWGHGYSNPQRLALLAEHLGAPLPASPEPPEGCSLCGGAFQNLGHWVDRTLAAAQDWEWSTFRCGSRWDPERLAREETLWIEVGSSWGESVRAAFNRELGKAVAAKTGRAGDREPSDMVFLADVGTGIVEVTVNPIRLAGRYRKFDRTLPQTHWPCRACRGRGCTRCSGTGKMYASSVEELIGGPLTARLRGASHTMHGMGREDIDARMLGRGRPFILEITKPHARTLDLAAATEEINRTAVGRVEVSNLVLASVEDIERVKSARPEKSYRVVIRGPVAEGKVKESLPLLVGLELAQRTPTRVAHRRADMVRRRTIREVKWVAAETETFTLEIRADAGTYIKEFVQGDGGRTRPSLSEILGSDLKVDALDVLEIHDQESA